MGDMQMEGMLTKIPIPKKKPRDLQRSKIGFE